jgi:two-component system, sensor histidine kinase and response regulator
MIPVPSNTVAPGKLNGSRAAESLRALTRPGVAWVVLTLCFIATLIGWQMSVAQLNDRQKERFELHTERVNLAIQADMEGYQKVLKGAAGLFAASDAVTRSEWHLYAQSLDIEERYPGIHTFGFIEQVGDSERAIFIATNRAERGSEFTILPSGLRSNYWVVKYVEPERDNSSVLGYDLVTEPLRREALEYARDTGKPALTRRIRLVQSVEDVPAILLLLPIYRRGFELKTIEDRRAAIEGWVAASFIMTQLMETLTESHDPQIDFEIFDDNRVSLKTWLYDADRRLHATTSQACTYATNTTLNVVNRKWLVHFSTRPAFDAATDYTETRLFVVGGLCISFLLFGITRSLATTRQHAVSLARQMTEKFRIQERAVISSSNGIFITDASKPNNPVLYANPAMETITGLSAEEMIGRTPGFLTGDNSDQSGLQKLQAAMTEGLECRVVLRCQRQDGSTFWNELSVSPVRDEDGIVAHYVGITEDITERKRAEETLRATSALQRAILDSAGYAVISTTPQGLINIFNAAAEHLTGYKAAEVIGKPTSLLIHDWTAVERRAEELSAELGRPIHPDFEVFVAKARLGQADEHEWTYIRKDGSHVPVLLSVTPVRDENGIILGFMGIASDITERKRAEKQLQEATLAAEAANRAKSEFLANMSHEIRTPMNAVMGMTELALRTELTPEQRSYLTAARNSANDLLTIINDVLDFSKIEAGKLTLHPESFRLRDALGVSLKAFSVRAAEKGLELTIRIDPKVPDRLVGDVGRLRQILNNLVGNALKFTHEGEVAVEVSVFQPPDPGSQLTLIPRAAMEPAVVLLHFIVRDTGIGIPQEKQRAVFDAFTQADASVTRHYGGTGLGLAIADKLCRIMGGDIWVESEPGKGSSFHFTAAFRASMPAEQALSIDLESLQGKRALIVDDHATTRQILGEMLAHWRMIPVPAANAIEAKAALGEGAQNGSQFLLCIVDARMPGTDVLQLARDLQKSRNGTSQIIMLLSSTGNSEEIALCRQAGIATHLVKPVGESELLNAVLRCSGIFNQDLDPYPPGYELQTGGRALRVLLAEDNAVNRELATTVLRKLGHSVVTVSNGAEAVRAWQEGDFELILMDVQMPTVDGIEATLHIREQEAGTGRHIPIVGLTAHAMKGDQEQGLASGMDEYVTKPLRLEDLVKAIERWIPRDSTAPAKEISTFDSVKLLNSLCGDTAALRRLVSIFLETTPELVAKIRKAVTDGDAKVVLHAAHTLKGSLTHLNERRAQAAASELEKLGSTSSLEGAATHLAELERNVGLFETTLRQWLKENLD